MALRVENLYKSFGNNQVLRDVSFEINKGEIVTVIGPSGAGKTTLLRCVNGLEKCDQGTIKIGQYFLCHNRGDHTVYCSKKDMKAIRRQIGYVFQNFNLFPHMTVLENIIEAPVQVLKMEKAKAGEKAEYLLERLGLLDKADSYPYQLSGGQQQRVAIARACALDPILMCFDEPTSALDPETREEIAKVMEDLAQANMAILVISHDMAFAKRVSDRLIFMEAGTFIAEGKKENQFADLEDQRIINYINS